MTPQICSEYASDSLTTKNFILLQLPNVEDIEDNVED